MKKFKIYPYCIECLTNLHVGSGGDNFGIVDKEIQRDQVDNTPIIHASSLKGAVREYFENCVYSTNSPVIIKYFGSDKKEQNNLSQGCLRFFEARLFAIPVRGIGNVSDYLGTSERLLTCFNNSAGKLDSAINKMSIPSTENTNAQTEYGDATQIATLALVGDNIAFIPNEKMITVLKNLPIIARNSLENGQSENLWYEEVVPRGSKFYFFVAVPDEETGYNSEFETHLLSDVVQIGANATVGYGFCKISKM
ncbi:MAG TPA: type III-B CRISPR module RAMP protein Cmr4 [Bacteroidales bacterium]|nr:type III-B CRISPR module RAMP protein Cmr4 [Bacteroidales bacterium]